MSHHPSPIRSPSSSRRSGTNNSNRSTTQISTWMIFVVGFAVGMIGAQFTRLVVVTNQYNNPASSMKFDQEDKIDKINHLKQQQLNSNNNNQNSTTATATSTATSATTGSQTSTSTATTTLVKSTTTNSPLATTSTTISTTAITTIDDDNNNNNNGILLYEEFVKQDGVVVATKIHGEPKSLNQLRQCLCLFHYAYNNRVLYDIIVFTTIQVSYDDIQLLQNVVHPAKLTVIRDNPGLQQMISNFTIQQQQHLIERCDNVKTIHDIQWNTKCVDIKTKDPLSYCWQAEFRSKHIWYQPSLQPYHTMLWIDSDAFCTKVWPKDPIKYFLQKELVIFFAHFPQGRSTGTDWHTKYIQAFNKSLCGVKMNEWGYIYPVYKKFCPRPVVHQIHGFFHITNLTFYRSPRVLKWFDILIGNTLRFSRRYDDQIGVTAPAAVWGTNHSIEMEAHGYKLDVYHNGRLDGKHWAERRFNENFWIKNGSTSFPEAYGNCIVNNSGR